MTDDYVLNAGVYQHVGRNLACISALLLIVHVLGSDTDIDPLAASIAGIMSMAGTQNTTSTSSFATNGFNSFTRATASDGVMFIFQLPAIIFLS